jgi:FkbM family methyltransferase
MITSSAHQFALTTLRRVGIYDRLKASTLYDVYFRLFDAQVIDDRTAELEFYRAALPDLRAGSLVFDVGANQGHKTDLFLRLGARVVAIDPDPANAATLRRRNLQYRWRPRPVAVVEKAVSDTAGVQTMFMERHGSAKNTLSRKWVETLHADAARFSEPVSYQLTREVSLTTLDQLFHEHGRPIYVKIDVEGHEPSVLRGMSEPVPCVSFEVNLPEFRGEGAEGVDRLHALAPQGVFNYIVDCRSGFALPQWIARDAFQALLDDIDVPSIEIFWRSGGPPRGTAPSRTHP